MVEPDARRVLACGCLRAGAPSAGKCTSRGRRGASPGATLPSRRATACAGCSSRLRDGTGGCINQRETRTACSRATAIGLARRALQPASAGDAGGSQRRGAGRWLAGRRANGCFQPRLAASEPNDGGARRAAGARVRLPPRWRALRWKVHVPRTASSSSTPMTACAPSRERHHWRLHQPGPDAHRGLATAAVGLARRALQIASAGVAEEPRCERGGPAPSDDYLPTTAWCDVLHRRPTPSLASARLLRAPRPPSRRNRPNACPTAPAPFRHVRVPELRPCAFAPTLLNPGGAASLHASPRLLSTRSSCFP